MNLEKIQYRLKDSLVTIYRRRPDEAWHCDDGPAYIREFEDGIIHTKWFHQDKLHRYDGPAVTNSDDDLGYYINNRNVTDIVKEWLAERNYTWETMSDIEKWELELFTRSL